MLCPICKSPMRPLFTSLICQNNCDQREAKIAEALYRAAMEAAAVAGLWEEPWDELEDEARQFFFKLARAALDTIEP